jgi:hypothetical protein
MLGAISIEPDERTRCACKINHNARKVRPLAFAAEVITASQLCSASEDTSLWVCNNGIEKQMESQS